MADDRQRHLGKKREGTSVLLRAAPLLPGPFEGAAGKLRRISSRRKAKRGCTCTCTSTYTSTYTSTCPYTGTYSGTYTGPGSSPRRAGPCAPPAGTWRGPARRVGGRAPYADASPASPVRAEVRLGCAASAEQRG